LRWAVLTFKQNRQAVVSLAGVLPKGESETLLLFSLESAGQITPQVLHRGVLSLLNERLAARIPNLDLSSALEPGRDRGFGLFGKLLGLASLCGVAALRPLCIDGNGGGSTHHRGFAYIEGLGYGRRVHAVPRELVDLGWLGHWRQSACG